MGIYDRDYIRREPPQRGAYGGGGLSAMRMWSVNTWLIVICAAVFVIDGFLPMRVVPCETTLREDAANVDPDLLVDGPLVAVPDRPGFYRAQQHFRDEKGPVLGWKDFQVMPFLQSFLHFSTERGFFEIEFWRFIGFQFLHGSMAHLLFNMIGLYFFGTMVERYLGGKRYLAFYLLCGLCGALMYTLLNLGGWAVGLFSGKAVSIPGLLFNDTYRPLIGASAGVFGVLMAGAFLAPQAKVLLFFIIPMKLQTLAYALVALALFTVITGGTNAGGEAGHIGGALAGFYFIRHPGHLHGFFDFLGYVDPTSHHYRKGGVRPRTGAGARGPKPQEIDRILAKISDRGIHSLTEREKRVLRDSAKD